MSILREPEKKALFRRPFFDFSWLLMKLIPPYIAFFTVYGVFSIYLNDFCPLFPQVSSNELTAIAVL